MRKLVLSMHVSIDGFATGPNKEMDWIHVDNEIFDYAGNMTNDADTALYGRVTYELMESYWPTAANKSNASDHDIQHSRWYNKVNKIVLSRTLKNSNSKVTFLSDNIVEQVSKVKEQPGKNIQIFGSPSACHTLIQNNLIDDFWLFVNPILVGGGTPVFPELKEKQKLRLLSTKAFSSGVILLHYSK